MDHGGGLWLGHPLIITDNGTQEIQLTQLTMAFVFREERKCLPVSTNKEVGPGTYEAEPEKESKMPKAYVPFGSMEPRIKEQKVKELTPGPGQYEILPQNAAERVVVSSATQDIKILQVPKPLAIFKSTTKRFNDPMEATPGPGQYYKEVAIIERRNIKVEEPSNKPKIIEHLIKINKYQSIPSIPSNAHAYGYNENERNQLELNEPPVQVIRGDVRQSVGPGHYNVTSVADRKRGVSWHNNRTIRQAQTKPATSLGPGSYDVHSYVPVVNYKPTSVFASSTMRTMDQRKGAIANKAINDKLNPKQSRVMSQKAPESTHIDSEEDEYEFIDDATPGPGSYLEISQVSKMRKGKNLHFGSTSRRFPELQNQKNPLGPGDYYQEPVPRQQSKSTSFKKQPAPFGSMIKRFDEKLEPGVIPGPGSYEPRNALEDRLIFKIQRGYRGQFGSTEQRFKELQEDKMGPGFYNPVVQPQSEQITTGSSAFKSKTNKGPSFTRKDINPPPGAYNVNYYDISKKVIKEEEEDPDLVIKKPGFNIGAERFREEVKKQDPFEDDDIIHQIQTRAQLEHKQRKNPAPFNSKQPRLQEKPAFVPGPGMYQTTDDKWNKRTFNILFADI